VMEMRPGIGLIEIPVGGSNVMEVWPGVGLMEIPARGKLSQCLGDFPFFQKKLANFSFLKKYVCKTKGDATDDP
jgi:hypothetical protein